ncbi:magnesium transporter CorA family protein [Marinifilum sp. RC60d5]|uniref:magnesium transporter CorA family protein n=1 Tax=Marinifilum sp. RC60d5 TaxID=3458414 RepID=UPI0040356EF2
MITIFKTFGGCTEIKSVQPGCWIHVVEPTQNEIECLTEQFQLPNDTISDILDADERPRVEYDDDWSLVIMRIPIRTTNNGVPYQTVPLGIYLTNNFTLSLCMCDNQVLPVDQACVYKDPMHSVNDATNFILQLFLRSGNLYMKYLKHINQMTNLIEQDLEKSIKNRELNQLLKLEKCMVFFITSIKANEIVLAKIRNSKRINNEINEDLLEDAIIENKQALEMGKIYSDIQSGMMDAFASVISNNLNLVMKQLTLISIILMIPTLIASIFGMNVPNSFENSSMAMPLIIIVSLILSIFGVLLFRKRQWF